MTAHSAEPKVSGSKPGPHPDPNDDLKTLPLAEVEKELASSPDGLTEAEAKKRLAQYGPNDIPEKKTNALLKFLGYFWGPIPWMIEIAVVLSAVVQHWPDFFIILVLVVANGAIGFWEEREAGNAIEALKARLAIKAGSASRRRHSAKPGRQGMGCRGPLPARRIEHRRHGSGLRRFNRLG
jgi:H+-transporting ATPase